MTTDNIGADLRLRGDRCQCATCGRYFNSTAAFDKHRPGKPGERMCVYPPELGMSMNATGYWITAAMPTDVIPTTAKESRT